MNTNKTIFQSVFGDAWHALPTVMHKHYANRPYTHDVVTLHGTMNIKTSKLISVLSPLLKLFGALVPHAGDNIPCTVYSKSDMHSANYILERHFNFRDRKPVVFRSVLTPVRNNEVVEIMRFGIGWHARYTFNGHKIVLYHKGYVIRLFGILVPIPIALILGEGYAEEEAIDENRFRMKMNITHPWLGQVYQYSGEFSVVSTA